MFLNQDYVNHEVKYKHENLRQMMVSVKSQNPNQVSALHRIRQFVQLFTQKMTPDNQPEVTITTTQEMTIPVV